MLCLLGVVLMAALEFFVGAMALVNEGAVGVAGGFSYFYRFGAITRDFAGAVCV